MPLDQDIPLDPASADRASKNRALENIDWLVERNRRDSGLKKGSDAHRAVRSVGIVGAGIMGTAIAAAHVRREIKVVLCDGDPRAVAAAAETIVGLLTDGTSDEPLPPEAARRLTACLVRPTDDHAAAAACDLVIESIVETLAAKRRLYEQLQPHLSSQTILTSNTSTIPISHLAQGLSDPSRFCGLHFFHPVGQRPLAEIVRGSQTGNPAIVAAVAHAKTLGKMPIVVDDGPGFLVNRLLLPYLGEAMQLLLEGAEFEDVERAALEFGMAKGPLRLVDEIGLDTTLQGGWVLAEAFPERIGSSPLLVSMIKAGRTGCKSGAGFFNYNRPPQDAATDSRFAVDPQVRAIVAQWADPPQQHTRRSILARLLLPMVVEATRVLEEGRVRDAGDIDLAVVFGLGFPKSAGGLLWWADTLGAARIVEMLGALASCGARVGATDMLLEMDRRKQRFYDAILPELTTEEGDRGNKELF